MLKRAHWFGAAAISLLASLGVAMWGCQGTCLSNSDCGDGTYCSMAVANCLTPRALGFCKPLPEDCTDVSSPVCGCDGKQYDNQCKAALAKTSVATMGTCTTACGGEADAGCSSKDSYCHIPDGMCGNSNVSGSCDPVPTSCTGATASPVCGCDGKTYASSCEAAAAGISVLSTGGCTCNTPFGTRGCAAGEYCDLGNMGGCLMPNPQGTCTAKPVTCSPVPSKVCGCNGQTYDNACLAAQAGESVALNGDCPPIDAGIGDAGDGG